MKNKLKKPLIIAFLFLFSFLALIPNFNSSVYAQDLDNETWYNVDYGDFIIKVYDADETEIFGERYTYAQTQWIISSIVSFFLPDGIERCVVAISTDETFLGGGIPDIDAIIPCQPANMLPNFLGSVEVATPQDQALATTIFNEMNNNPLSGVGYVVDKTEQLNPVKEVHAQQTGFGFDQLEPIRELWQAVRDMSYFLLVLIAIVLAFMIMFRTKTSPQTVITVQSAIPKLVIALILITFSYAIAGFIVDLSYVVLGIFALVMDLLDIVDPGVDASELFTIFLNAHPLVSMFISLFVYSLIFVIIGAGASLIVGPLLGLGGGGALTLVIMLIFGIVMIIVYLKIIWTLLKAFIQVVLLTVVGPIYILLGALPGGIGFGSWVKSLAAQVAVFPTVVLMLFLSHFFFWRLRSTTIIGDILSGFDWLNPYQLSRQSGAIQGQIALPGFNLGTGLIGFFGAFAIMFLTPHAASIIKSLIQGQPFGFGSAIGETLGPVRTGGRAGGTFGASWGLDRIEGGPRQRTWYTKAARRLTGIR